MSVNEALQKDQYISQPVHSITVICSFFFCLAVGFGSFLSFSFFEVSFFCATLNILQSGIY